MQNKKDIPLFIVIALLFTWLVSITRDGDKPLIQSAIPQKPAHNCTSAGDSKTISPLNLITQGIFNISS